MASTKEIRNALDERYGCKETYRELAENSKITSDKVAYNYDAIKRTVAQSRCESADALYVGRHIYFIEFKTGFARIPSDANQRTHKENLQLRIKLKAYESLGLFEKVLLPELTDGVLDEGIQKCYIAVIDSNEDPMAAYCDVLQEAGHGIAFNREECRHIFDNSLANYRRMIDGKYVFYDQVRVWYDFDFDREIAHLH